MQIAYNSLAMLRERLRAWMAQNGKSREEVAKLLLVSKQTVNGWLLRSNPREMSERQRVAIEALIRPKPQPGCVPVQLMLTPEQAEKIKDLSAAEITELFMSIVDAVHKVRNK